MSAARSEDSPAYGPVAHRGDADDVTIASAIAIIERRWRVGPCGGGNALTAPPQMREFVRLQIGLLPYESFGCVWLDAQSRYIEWSPMFRGTLTQTSVYPREVVKEALRVNAAAVCFAHNHPSGSVEPSRADEFLTQTLRTALALVDVRVLDHIVVSATDAASFAERGLL